MSPGGRQDRPAWRDVVVPVLVAQALSLVGWASGTAIVRHLRGPGFQPASTHGIFGWMSWDGGFYRLIAEQGYAASSHESLRFFPLYPLLARWLSIPLLGNTDLALLVIAKVSVVFAAIGIVRAVRAEGGSPRVARCAVWMFVLFPGAFVLSWGYAEALFVALAVWCILALRARRFGWAVLLGVAAGLCRPIGIALAAAALVEVARDRSGLRAKDWALRVAAVAAAPLGSLAFLAYSGARGTGFWSPFTIQDAFRHPQDPVTRILALPGDVFGPDAFTTGLHAPFVIAFLVVLVLTFRRLPASYGLFAAVVLAAALGADNLNSIERYAMSAFPLAITTAFIVTTDERLEYSAYAVGGALTVGLCTLALTGSFVP